MIITVKDKRHLHSAAKLFLEHTAGKKIFALHGAMGAGKTTFIKALCETIGTSDIVSSPTFTLVNEYRALNGESIFHIDFYRIKKLEEVLDFGVEEYLTGSSYCFIEWPELAEEILPAETVKVAIMADDDGKRIIDVP